MVRKGVKRRSSEDKTRKLVRHLDNETRKEYSKYVESTRQSMHCIRF